MSERLFENKVAVITAAGNGIGRATALEFAREGARLQLVDIDATALLATAECARQFGATVGTHELDCTSEDQVRRTFERFDTVDILVNGIGSSARERSSEFRSSKAEVWDYVHGVSLRTAMLCARQVVPGMCVRRSGRIVNVSSEAALRPTAKMAEYAAAKAAVIGFTRALAQELANFGITVNVVAPGLTDTRALGQLPPTLIEAAAKEIPLGRIGRPEEIAYAIAFLASPRAAFITGQTLAVNGGRSFV